MAILISHFYDRERTLLVQDALQTTRALTASVDRDLGIGENVALALATSPNLATKNFAAFHAQARSLLGDKFPGFTFVLSDASGQQLVNVVRPYGNPLPRHGNPDQLRRVFETGKTVISDVYIGGVMRRPLVGIDVPVWRSGKVIYDLTVGFLPERLGDILKEQHLPPNRIAAIFDSKGIIVARTHEPEKFVGKSGAAPMIKLMQKTNEGMLEVETLEGTTVFAIFSRSTTTGWSVAIGIPKAAILTELLNSVAFITSIVIILLAAGFVASLILGERISRSVKALTGSAIDLGAGRPVVIPRSYLSETIEVEVAMEKAGSELDAYRNHLETLVAERTAALQTSTTRLEQILETAGEGIYGIDVENRLTFANRAAADILGWASSNSMLGLSGEEATRHLLANGKPCSEDTCKILQTLNDGEVRRVEDEFFCHTDGTHIPVEYVVAPHVIEGKVTGAVIIFGDISERNRLATELKRQAHIDYLTDVCNRGYFMEQAELELSRAVRYDNPLSLFMLDVDFFKQVNDTYGHKAGDMALVKLTDVCRKILRGVDIIGRLGGEEFAVLLPETDKAGAIEVAERLRLAIASTKVALESGLPISFTVSIGVASLSSREDNMDMLLNQADKALYEAKATGRNKVCVAKS